MARIAGADGWRDGRMPPHTNATAYVLVESAPSACYERYARTKRAPYLHIKDML